MSYEIKRFPFEGGSSTFEDRYKPLAMGIGVDSDGYEFLQLDGKPSERTVRGAIGLMGAMGEKDARPSPERRYMDHIPFGAGDPGERVALLDKENLQRALLYPTIGLLWEAEVTDPEITLAYCRAYNRWIADFCRDTGSRLVPIAHLTLLDPEGSAAELERAVADGCRARRALRDSPNV